MTLTTLLKKYSSLTLLLCLGTISLTSFADKEPFEGFYTGVKAGYAQGSAESTSRVLDPSGNNVNYYLPPLYTSLVNQAGANTLRASSPIGEITVGYDMTLSHHWLLGLELGMNFFNLNSSNQQTVPYPLNPPYTFTLKQSFQDRWLLSARPRIGFHTQKFLVYAIGGVALTQFQSNFSYTDNIVVGVPTNGQGSTATNGVQVGWNAGGGMEFLLSQKWALQLEASWFYFPAVSSSGSLSVTPNQGFLDGNPLSSSTDLNFTILELGIKYYL